MKVLTPHFSSKMSDLAHCALFCTFLHHDGLTQSNKPLLESEILLVAPVHQRHSAAAWPLEGLQVTFLHFNLVIHNLSIQLSFDHKTMSD